MLFLKNSAKIYENDVIFYGAMPVVKTNMAAVEDPKASNALPRSFLRDLSQQEVQQMFVCENFLSIFCIGPKNDGGYKCE